MVAEITSDNSGMFHNVYDEMVRFASEGELADELTLARGEFLERTGELFESDPAYERRIAAFLEWYVLDRAVSTGTHQTPAKLYIDHVTPQLTTPEIQRIRSLTKTRLSLFEFRRFRDHHLEVVDMLAGEKLKVFERRQPAGLEPRDILEARLVAFDDKLLFSDAFAAHPRQGRKAIAKVAKLFRKNSGSDPERLDLVHRVGRLANKCERYQHVDPKQIFAEL